MLRRSVALVFALCLVGGRVQHLGRRRGRRTGATAGSGAASGEPIVIGFPADLSTDWAYYDSPMQEGAQFAVDQINESGGVLGRPLELQTVDMRNDVAEAAKVTQQLIDDGAVYLIGTVGDGILAEGQVACATGVPISTGLGTAPSLVGDMGECAYQLVMSDNIQAAVLAEYAHRRGVRDRLRAGLERDPLHARTCPSFFTDAFENGGGTVVGTDQYKLGAGDYSAVVTKIANVDPAPDAVFTPMYIPDSVVFLRQLRQAGLDHAGAVHRRQRRRRAAGRGRQGDRRAHVLELGVHGRGRPRRAGVLRRLQRGERQGPELLRRGDRLRRGQPGGRRDRGGGQHRARRDHRAARATDYTGISGHVVMDPETRRADKPAALIQMDGTEFTCLGQPDFPSYVPAV